MLTACTMNGFPNNLISYTRAIGEGLREIKHLNFSTLRKVFSLMGKREKIVILALFALALGSLFWSGRNFYYRHTQTVPDKGGSYTEGLLGQPTYLNPLLAHEEPDLSLTHLLFASLYKYDASGQLAPDLADGLPQISPDQKQYTINLKRDALWHNNKPLNADDVIFTFQILKDPSYKSPNRGLWQTTSVEKLSDFSIKFITKDVSGPFLDNLTLPILPKNIWSKVDAQNFLLSKFNLEAIGSGPYTIKQIKKLPSGKVEAIRLEAFEGYFGGRAKIDQLNFNFFDTENDLLNAFHAREIQGLSFVPLGSNLYLEAGQKNAQIITVPLPQYQIVFFNLTNKILGDVAVRRALSLATNRQEIINQVFSNQAVLPSSPFVYASDRTSPGPSSADIFKAQSLLDEAGWKLDAKTNQRVNKKGQALEFTLATSDSQVNSKAAELLIKQWQALNIKVNLTVLPYKQLTQNMIKPRNFDALLFPQKFGADPDPFLFWHSSQIKDPGYNLTGFDDSVADKLITEARSTTDKNIRRQKYLQFNDLINSKVPVILVDQTECVYVLDNKIKNVELTTLYDPSGRFTNIQNWYINTTRVWK